MAILKPSAMRLARPRMMMTAVDNWAPTTPATTATRPARQVARGTAARTPAAPAASTPPPADSNRAAPRTRVPADLRTALAAPSATLAARPRSATPPPATPRVPGHRIPAAAHVRAPSPRGRRGGPRSSCWRPGVGAVGFEHHRPCRRRLEPPAAISPGLPSSPISRTTPPAIPCAGLWHRTPRTRRLRKGPRRRDGRACRPRRSSH